ncbi:PASTA domain-containing protein [Odoribacter lunatus]|uniref:PASTA domain-containing protein n=1 Tax=Odoribacter lunatus TaxID=2941335 RepID=UPI00203BA604|nr:PASTA domain-containing protein [Odoribacter lunatus]
MAKLSKYPRLTFFFLNLLVAVILLFVGGYFVLSRLDVYTSHGEYISVPAFQLLSPEEAQEVASAHQLRVMIVDSIYDDSAEPGVVLEQYPLNGAHVKENRMIRLITNAHSPERVPFPQLNNAPYRQTLQTLHSKGFKIGHISYAPSQFKNLVLTLQLHGKDIEPGTLIQKGSTIDIVLGEGRSKNFVAMPKVQGLLLNQAIGNLKENYLNIGKIIPDNSIKGTPTSMAIVYRQNPDAQQQPQVKAGTYVNLYITLDKQKIQELDSLLIVTE